MADIACGILLTNVEREVVEPGLCEQGGLPSVDLPLEGVNLVLGLAVILHVTDEQSLDLRQVAFDALL